VLDAIEECFEADAEDFGGAAFIAFGEVECFG